MTKDIEYEAAISKGAKLLADEQQYVSQESVFKDVQNLRRYGYTLKYPDRPFPSESLRSALDTIGSQDDVIVAATDFVHMIHNHTQANSVDGQTYEPTCATFAQICNPTAGILIADMNWTAFHVSALGIDDRMTEAFPPLLHWSDIAFLQYKLACENVFGSAATKLDIRYIFRFSIINSETISILTKIVNEHGSGLFEVWPGLTIDPQSEQGKAILGTPNGSGVLHLLAQHQKELGKKSIGKISLFYAPKPGDLYRWPTLLFEIV